MRLQLDITRVKDIRFGERIKRGYDKRMAAGAVAAGGTLGIMIPLQGWAKGYGKRLQASDGYVRCLTDAKGGRFVIVLWKG